MFEERSDDKCSNAANVGAGRVWRVGFSVSSGDRLWHPTVPAPRYRERAREVTRYTPMQSNLSRWGIPLIFLF